MGFFVLDAVAGAVVSLFIMFGGYQLISESEKMMQGEDPRMERLSNFLKSHRRISPARAALVSLWFFNLQNMTQQENLERVKKSLWQKVSSGAAGQGLRSCLCQNGIGPPAGISVW